MDKRSKLKREIKYLEKGMKQIRVTLTKLQQGPTQTPVSSTVGSRPKDSVNKIKMMRENKVGFKRITSLLTPAHIPL